MKIFQKIILLIVLLAALALPGAALAQDRDGDEFVFGSVFLLASEETLNGNLYVFGGTATIEQGARVNGDVIILGGSVDLAGEVDGDITIVSGNADLQETAVVEGDLNAVAGNVDTADGAVVEGNFNRDLDGPFVVTPPGGRRPFDRNFNLDFNPIAEFVWFMFRSFLWAALAIVAVLFIPGQTGRVAQTATSQPLISIGVGLLTVVVLPIALIILAITIIGIPVSILGVLLMIAVWAFGIVSLGAELGRRLAGFLKQDWALPVSAGIGTFVLVFLANGIGRAIPCVGWIVPTALGMLGVGAVLLTRLGTQGYPPSYPPAPGAPVPPASPIIPPVVSSPGPYAESQVVGTPPVVVPDIPSAPFEPEGEITTESEDTPVVNLDTPIDEEEPWMVGAGTQPEETVDTSPEVEDLEDEEGRGGAQVY